jgi:hypothetical protein
MCERPLETSAVCNGQVKWSPEPMGKLHLFKYSFSHTIIIPTKCTCCLLLKTQDITICTFFVLYRL